MPGDLLGFLAPLGLEAYAPALEQNGYDMEALLLTDEDAQDFAGMCEAAGILKGHAVRLKHAIKRAASGRQPGTSTEGAAPAPAHGGHGSSSCGSAYASRLLFAQGRPQQVPRGGQEADVDPQVQAGLQGLKPGEESAAAEEVSRRLTSAMGERVKVKPRIVIIGQAGTGKSSIINAAFRLKAGASGAAQTGAATHTTKGINTHQATEDCPVHLYDSEGFCDDAARNDVVKQNLADLVQKRREASLRAGGHSLSSPEGLGERVHAVWWVDHGRLNPRLFSAVREIFGSDVPFFVILNKCDQPAADVDQRLSLATRLYGGAKVFPVVAAPTNGPFKLQCEQCGTDDIMVGVAAGTYECRTAGCANSQHAPVSYKRPYGIDKLLRATYEAMPELLRGAFLLAQRDWIEGRWLGGRGIVAIHSALAGGIGASPIPFSDFPLLVANQVAMGRNLGGHWEVGIGEGAIKQLLASVMSGAVLAGVGLLLGSGLKLIPGVGTAAGIATDVAVASSVTFALGELMNKLFCLAKENDISQLDAETMHRLMPIDDQRALFRRAFGQGFRG